MMWLTNWNARLLRRCAAGLMAGVVIALTAAPALAKTKTHKDEVRGFECKIDDKFEQIPPKPGDDNAHVAAYWNDPSPAFRARGQPKFRIIWTVTPKGDAVPAAERELPPWAKDLPEAQQEAIRSMLGGTKESLQGDIDRIMRLNEHLFGPFQSFAERAEEQASEKRPETIETGDDHELRVVEVNYHKKYPKDTDATWWMWIAFTEFETDAEKIELGFYGYCDLKDAKDFRKKFEATVKSFKLKEFEETEAEAGGNFVVENPDHPEEKKVAEFIKEKVIKGWSTLRTPHYLIVYDDDVDKKKIVNRVAREIEALRAQVYEVLFPPDRPIESISFVRVCETAQQYSAYGGPGGSAGYWSPGHEELVLYQDKNDKKDAIRVLYHEAFHQYIYYSVGSISPHSWFNEGHGDFFSGHVYKSGKFKRAPFGWRTGQAKEGKRRWKDGIFRFRNAPTSEKGETTEGGRQRLDLREWLTWRQPEYYGNNDFEFSQDDEGKPRPIPGGMNYALGWSFIYFLRTTSNEDYQKILPRYFNTLKSFVTQDREAQDKALEDGLDGGGTGVGGEGGEGGGEADPAGGEPKPEAGEGATAAPESGGTTDKISRGEWHGESLKEATRGIDLEQLEKDWLDHNW